MLDAATGLRSLAMFDFDVQPQSAPDLLALLGRDGHAIRTILEEPARRAPR